MRRLEWELGLDSVCVFICVQVPVYGNYVCMYVSVIVRTGDQSQVPLLGDHLPWVYGCLFCFVFS